MEFNHWFYPLIGGVLIGLSASLLLLLRGRIFGVTGIVYNALFSYERKWRFGIIIGIICGSMVTGVINPQFFNYYVPTTTPWMILAGLLVGFGTSMGSGCTSGHGICGLPRFSKRSFSAVMTFMFFGAVTVYLSAHVFGLY